MSTNTQWSERMCEGFSKSSVNNDAKTPLVLTESLDHNTIKPQKAGTKLTSPFEEKISSCGCLTREKNGAAPATHTGCNRCNPNWSAVTPTLPVSLSLFDLNFVYWIFFSQILSPTQEYLILLWAFVSLSITFILKRVKWLLVRSVTFESCDRGMSRQSAAPDKIMNWF